MNKHSVPGRKFIPQERDIAILRYIKDHKTLNLDLIHKRFWQGKTFHSCYYRMRDLEAGGVVKRVNMDILRSAAHFYLTPMGLRLLADHGLASRGHRLPVPDAADIIRSDFQHNLRVAAIRVALETDPLIKVTNWISDEQIKSDPQAHNLGEGKKPGLRGIRRDPRRERKFAYRIPDGIFDLEDAEREGKVIMEYEHGRYMRWKFRAYLANWEERWGDYQKLIVAATQERVGALKSWCLEDLRDRYRLEVEKGSREIEERASAYLFLDYHSLIEKGLTGAKVLTPVGEMNFAPMRGNAIFTEKITDLGVGFPRADG